VECPAEAIAMQNFSDEKISVQIKNAAALWATKEKPQIFAFVCNWSYNANADGFEWPQSVYVIPVKCSGRVDPLHVLRAFMLGADGVLIISCDAKDCHYIFGSATAEKRVKQMKEWLQAVGINPERLHMEQSSVGNEQHLDEVLKSFSTKLESIGSTPLKEAMKK
jgi:coenzyme F420-reducing hydrogenase delta subunit